MDSVGLVLDSGPTFQITILRPDDAKKVLSRWTRSNRVQHEFTIEILRFLDSPHLGFYKIIEESNAGDGVKAITNIVLGTRYPNGLHTKNFFANLARTFVTLLGDS